MCFTETSFFWGLRGFEVWGTGSAHPGKYITNKTSFLTILYQCVLFTNGGRRDRSGAWDANPGLLAPGQAGWGRVGRRREVDRGARYATQLQKQDKRSVFRI